MKYTAQSAKYVVKNLIYLLPFAIIPALFLSVSTDEEAIINVLKAVYHGNLLEWTFGDLFCAISVLNVGSWQGVVFGLFGVIVIVPCMALMMAILEKHFRIGKRTFNGIWNKINDNFLSTLGYVLLLLAIYEVWSLLLSALLFFFSRITVAVLAYILACLVYLAMHVLLLFAVSSIYLWLPCMQITGFAAFEALHYSYQLVTPVKWLMVCGQMLALLGVELLLAICAAFIPTSAAFLIWTTLVYTCMIMVFCVRMQIAYFDRDNMERADLIRYYQK